MTIENSTMADDLEEDIASGVLCLERAKGGITRL
jgi:hypothetical protein